MKILYICHKPPVPNVDGGTFAMKQFIEVLVKNHQADAYVFHTYKHPFTAESETFLSDKFNAVYSERLNTETSLIGLLKSVFSRKSYILSRFQSKEMHSKLQNNIDSYDCVVADSLFALNAFVHSNLNYKGKLVIRNHNVEHEIWSTLTNSKPFFIKWIYRLQTKLLKREEIALNQQVDVNLCITKEDENTFRKLLPNKKHLTLPIYVEASRAEIDYSCNDCFFLGSLNWQPNQETVEYLVNSCWNREDFSSIPLKIAGNYSSELKLTVSQPNVKLVGSVLSAEEFMAQNGILVAPVFSGSGAKIKILEALSVGVPCITTNLGAQGVDVSASGIYIAESPGKILKIIHSLQNNTTLREEISRKSKVYIENQFSFVSCSKILEEAFGV